MFNLCTLPPRRFSAIVAAVFVLGAACAPALHSAVEDRGERDNGTTPRQDEENRAALEELLERARGSNSPTPTPAAAEAADEVGDDRWTAAPAAVDSGVERSTAAPAAVTVGDDSEPGGVLTREALQQFVAAGPHNLLTSVELEPARNEDGAAIGFQIARVHPEAEWVRRAGVYEGDIVTTVNGRSFAMPDAFMALFESLAVSDEITVALIRGGVAMTLTWPVVSTP